MQTTPAPLPFEDQLRAAALRVTAPRTAVLAEVHARPHADVETLTTAVRARLGSVSTQAVYDVLRALTQARLVRRIEPAGSPARYEARVGDNHHHVVCRSCGDLSDVDCVVGEAPCLDAPPTNGFVIDEAEVTYWGTCPSCQQADSRRPAPTVTTSPLVAQRHTTPAGRSGSRIHQSTSSSTSPTKEQQ